MSINSTAIQRGGMLAKQAINASKKQAQQAGVVKVDKPNRAQRRAAKKQESKA